MKFIPLQFYWATFCKTVRPVLSDRCLSLSVLPVTFVAKRLDGSSWHEGIGLDPGHAVLDMDPAPPPQKKGSQPPQFSACGMSIAAKQLDGSRCQLVRR